MSKYCTCSNCNQILTSWMLWLSVPRIHRVLVEPRFELKTQNTSLRVNVSVNTCREPVKAAKVQNQANRKQAYSVTCLWFNLS